MPAMNGDPCPDRWNMFDWSELDLIYDALTLLESTSEKVENTDIWELLEEIEENRKMAGIEEQ